MEFSLDNLKHLLENAGSLRLFSEDKRQAFIQATLNAGEEEQHRVFDVLLKAKQNQEEADNTYSEEASKILDDYIAKVQKSQKDTLDKLRKKKERKAKKEDELKMDNLLNELNLN